MLISNLGPELAQAAEAMIRNVLLVQSGETVLITADTASDMRTVGWWGKLTIHHGTFMALCGGIR